MNKVKGFALCLALLCTISVIIAVPRNLVVVEVGTGTWCQFCPGAAMGCHDLLQNGQPVAIVKNQNGDTYANTYSNARNSFYGITGYPTAFFDGLNPTVGGSNTTSMYSNYLPKVTSRIAVPSHYSLSAVGSQNGNQYTAAVTVSKPEADTNTNVKLHAVLTESNIPQVWFNQTTVENVNRLMTPDQNGTLINLNTGETTTVNLNFTPNAGWNIANCEVVFFLQNMTSKEILQGVKYSLADLVDNFPISHQSIEFPDTYVHNSSTIPITITNRGGTTASGTIAINNPVFTCSEYNFIIPATQSATLNVTFLPTSPHMYSGVMTISSNLPYYPNIDIPLSGQGLSNVYFSADITTGPVPLSIQYTDQSTPGQYPIITWIWSFGDGGSSTLQNPVHIYQNPGVYTVSLTVMDQIYQTSTLVRPDYITVVEQVFAVELLSEDHMSFGNVWLEEQSAWQQAILYNTGNVDLTLSEAYFTGTVANFELSEPFSSQVLPPGAQATFNVRFAPQQVGAISDTLVIVNNSANQPLLKVRLTGTGEYVPLQIPQNVQVVMDGYDAVISWDPVTQNLHGQPVTPDRYIVLYSEWPYENNELIYYYLTSSTGLSATHHEVALFRDNMFYKVKAIKFYRGDMPPAELDAWLESNLTPGMREEEVSHLLNSSK